MIAVMTTKASTGRSRGRVTWKKARHGPAPSISAASSTSFGMFWMPAKIIKAM